MIRWRMTEKRRKRILKRDGHRCTNQACATPAGKGPFEIHHVVALFYRDIDPEKWTIEYLESDDNLVALCIDCHKAYTAEQAAIRGKLRRLTKERKPTRRKIPSRPFPSLRRLKGSPTNWRASHDQEEASRLAA